MKKNMKIWVVAIPIVVAAVFVYVLAVGPRHAPPSPVVTKVGPLPAGSLVDLSNIIYDAKTTVPGTEVTFSYPKQGYYGRGVQLLNNPWTSDLPAGSASFPEIESLYLTSLHDEIYHPQQISIRVFRLDAATSIDQILSALGMPGPYYPVPGRFESINGKRYYLQPGKTSGLNPYTIYGYEAYTIMGDRLLVVSFNGGFDGSDTAKTPDLVVQFLSRLDFTCKSDCSSNSAPIEMTKSEQ